MCEFFITLIVVNKFILCYYNTNFLYKKGGIVINIIELKNNIILELLLKNKISIGETIDYNKFAQLYSLYNYLPEFYFAKILDINYRCFIGLKEKRNKAVVLKNFDYNIFKDAILNYLLNNNIVSYNLKITYKKIVEILKIFPFLNEDSLCDILEIKISRIQNLKHNENDSTVVLKRKYILNHEEKLIIEDLVNQQCIYPGKEITFEDFTKLNKFYPNVKPLKFAEILEISTSQFYNMKYSGSKSIILKSKIKDFIEKQKNAIINELINKRNAYLKEKINYKRFCELYKGYEYINEVIFAQYILGINFNTFKSLKFNNKNAIILKKIIELTDKQCIDIYNFVLDKHNLQEGTLITYNQFLNIYNAYAKILTEKQFAEILGIDENKFDGAKYNNTPIRILNGITVQKIYFIKSFFSEKRFYTKEEIEKITNKYNITLEDIIIYIINKQQYFILEDYINAYNLNNGLFIGKIPLSDNFFQENYDNILKYIKYIIYNIKGKELNFSKEDVSQDILLYIYENCGDLERNFNNSDIFYKKMSSRTTKYIIGLLINHKRKNITSLSIDNEKNDFLLNKAKILMDNKSIEEYIVNMLEPLNSTPYNHVLNLIEFGYSLDESIKYLASNLKVDKNRLFNEIKQECVALFKKR